VEIRSQPTASALVSDLYVVESEELYDFSILRNFETKAGIYYCFMNFTIARYGAFCIIIGQKITYHGISFVPNEIFNFYYFRLGRKGLIRAKQALPFVLNENRCFVRDEKDPREAIFRPI
jgi:hypothetical protein